jgi:hypothetical protein
MPLRWPLLTLGVLLLVRAPSAVTAHDSAIASAEADGRVVRLPAVDAPPTPEAEVVVESDETSANAGPGGGRDCTSRSPVKLSLFWSPAQDLSTQAGELTMSGESLDVTLPLRIEPGRVWLATSGVDAVRLGSGGRLPDSLAAIPDELWRVTAGVMHFRDLDNGFQVGGILNFGSASDEPFASWREATANAIGFLNIPYGPRDAWSFSLFYSPTSQLPFPVPGVAYVWRPDETLTAKIGIPFAVDYRPTDDFSATISYTPLTNVEAMVRRKLGEKWNAFGGYSITNETYWLADRSDDDERLYLFDQRLTVGVERELAFGLRLDFSAAYVFDRQIFQAESFTRDRRDEIGIEPGVLGMTTLSWSR